MSDFAKLEKQPLVYGLRQYTVAKQLTRIRVCNKQKMPSHRIIVSNPLSGDVFAECTEDICIGKRADWLLSEPKLQSFVQNLKGKSVLYVGRNDDGQTSTVLAEGVEEFVAERVSYA